MFNKNYNDMIDNSEKRRIDPYSRDRRTYNRNNYNNNEQDKNNYNMNNDYTSPLKMSSNFLMHSNKTNRFQNENLTVHRVSPFHYQYKTNFYDDGGYNDNNNFVRNTYNGGQSFNVEQERNFNRSISNNNYINIDNNNSQYNNGQQQQRYNNNQNIRYKTHENYYNRNNFNNNLNNNQYNENNNTQMRRKNSDLNNEYNNNRYRINDKNRYYLKDPCDYYRGEEIDDGFRHYSPQDNDYNGSRYGGYIYNYYLNAPMRSDKSEDWRFPPLYYYKPNYDPEKKIFINSH